MNIPADLKYTQSHEWARLEADGTVTVGITDHAQEALGDLGVSHVYVSPFLRARPGSTHGYDVTDPRVVAPELGGESAFRRLGDSFGGDRVVDMPVAESCIAGNVGAELAIAQGRVDKALFGERHGMCVISCANEDRSELKAAAARHRIQIGHEGEVGGDRLRYFVLDVQVRALREAFESGLARALEGVTSNA